MEDLPLDKQKLAEAQKWIKNELNVCADFWLKNGMDKENGGVYTCLDRKGEVYSTDKSVWMQGRCAWTFAHLCRLYGKRDEWMEASKSCLDFMEKYCINPDADGRMYFTVTAEGKPLRQRRYCFSEGFMQLQTLNITALQGKRYILTVQEEPMSLFTSLITDLLPTPQDSAPRQSLKQEPDVLLLIP